MQTIFCVSNATLQYKDTKIHWITHMHKLSTCIKCTICVFNNENINVYIKHEQKAHCITGNMPTLLCQFTVC